MRNYRKTCKAGNGLRKTAAATAFAALLAATSGLLTDAAAAPWSAPSFFGSIESRSGDIAPFTKWTSTLRRFTAERAAVARQPCDADHPTRCAYDAWRRLLAGLDGKSRWRQLVAVNAYMNERAYVSDLRKWGRSDYWATPGEFLTGSGDCEDYAIAKFLSLKALGWTDAELRLVAVKDNRMNSGHAVLVAFHGSRTWLLDNQLAEVVPTAAVTHYEVVYSINEESWWRHSGALN